MAFKIRKLTQADVEQVAKIESVTFPHPFTANEIEQALYQKEKDYFVVELFSDIIGEVVSHVTGYCGIAYLDEDKVEILTIAIMKDYQYQGQGKFLLEMIIRYLQASQIKTITLEVRPSNIGAIKLYESFNFEKVAVRKNYYRDPSEDAYVYQKNM